MFEQKLFTCCFTGHRAIASEHAAALPELLSRTLRGLIFEGYTSFAAGGARGFDMLAAEAVLSLRQTNPRVRLLVIAPCLDQTRGWPPSEVRRYERIADASDDFTCLAANYYPGCMRARNRALVDQSGLCLSYHLRDRSGTGQTVAYARRQGLEVVNLAGQLPPQRLPPAR